MDAPQTHPLRYVVTPAVKELYEEDQEGYDALMEEPALEKLSNENDRVSGAESIYGHILNHRPRVTVTSVTGNEGLISMAGSVIMKLIRSVKNFFKWIWSFFGSKEAINKTKSTLVQEKLGLHGAKDGEIPYNATTFTLYPKTGKPDNNLNWVSGVMTGMEKVIGTYEAHADNLHRFFTEMTQQLTGDETTSKFNVVYADFKKKSAELFVAEGKTVENFLGARTLKAEGGRYKLEVNYAKSAAFKGATFQVSTTQLRSLFEEYNKLDGKMKLLNEKQAKLEDTLVKALNKSLNAAKDDHPALKKPIDYIKQEVRQCMVNMKMMTTALYQADWEILKLLSSCVKKG